MKTVSIQGREYVPVSERIKEFRKLHPDYSLVTDLVDVTPDHALIKASIVDEKGRILAQGTAFERAGSSFINKGSHVENCETSAWGRALGALGIGIDASVATADEVANAVLNQDASRKPTVAPGSTKAPARTPKQQPTKEKAMEYLTECKSMTDAATVFGQLNRYSWSDQDKSDILECYQNVAKRFSPPKAVELANQENQ
jgi:hypothetical protein